MIIGIDLGTTNSLVSYWTAEGPKLIPNAFGEHLTPSVVSMDEDSQLFIGKIAKERLITHPDRTAAVFKRNMGTSYSYTLGDRTFLPEELSALILKSLKEDAEHHLGTEVTEAVISIPAYFNDKQRKATKRAGELAGLKVERLITEPTSAAIAYGIYAEEDDMNMLVFDLGGGTFDVSILEFFEGIIEVKAVAGNNYLGGEDFTTVLIDSFLEHYELDETNLDGRTLNIIMKEAEKAKFMFSHGEEVTMRCLIDGIEKAYTISISEYVKRLEFLIKSLKTPMQKALRDADLDIDEIDKILLVGGASKLPIIKQFISKICDTDIYAEINPDEVVALGASVQAALKVQDEMLKETVLTDVASYTLGVNIAVEKELGHHESGHYLPIIERNATIPISRVKRLYPLHSKQEAINVIVYQGEGRFVKDNVNLGELSVEFSNFKAGSQGVDVRFTYDINGLLEVEATTVSTGEVERLVIEQDENEMSQEEIEARLEALAYLKIHPREHHENTYLIAKGNRLYSETLGDIREDIAKALIRFEDALDTQKTDRIEIEKGRLERLINSIEDGWMW